MKKTLFILFIASILLLSYIVKPKPIVAYFPASTNYRLINFGFGAGGTASSSSTSFSLFGTLGETDVSSVSSTNYTVGAGLTYTLIASVPAAPLWTNPATNYDRLFLQIKPILNPSDYTYAVAISTDNFVTDKRYIQSDNTPGSTYNISSFRSFASWGGTTGIYITNLKSSTTYYVKVKARQGFYSESEFGPVASVITSDPSVTFGLSGTSITFANLNNTNSFTDTQSTTLTTSTNAFNGYTIYAKETQALTVGSNTIADFPLGTNASPATWSGNGFGYTTSDNNLAGTGGVSRFSAGTKYAAFTQSASTNGDPVADDPGPVTNPSIVNEAFTITYKVATANTQAPGSYTNTIIYSVYPVY